MTQTKFTEQQVVDLLKNKNIAKCSQKSITFSKEFKLAAVRLYEQGLDPWEIFEQAGFVSGNIGRRHRNDCLHRWKKVFRQKGPEGLSESRGRGGRGGGRPKTKWKTETERIEWLEAKVAYLSAENNFLAKLRAKRAG